LGDVAMTLDPTRLETAYQTALSALLAERHPDGYWVGELSSSALATATAVSALALSGQQSAIRTLIDGGLRWLVSQQNDDGGWGDTDRSLSNISTTMLCRAAFALASRERQRPEEGAIARSEAYLDAKCGKNPAERAEAIRQRYGKDRTFSVPILMTAALAGFVPWTEVPPLPFELACFPQSWFRFLRLPVVSYALPALIAIGQAVYHHRLPWNPITRMIRASAKRRSLRVLERIQPSSGGFLEATPLTSFVVMALASIGRGEHQVVKKGIEFLINSVRSDGSWPIDSNLSVWVTTLSVNALAAAGELSKLTNRAELREWLIELQGSQRHPYTGAEPGGWGWTHLPGSVPDGDDTPGAFLALAHLYGDRKLPVERNHPFADGLRWLGQLQNKDGGFPTFCHGWGTMPFDRSGSDLTAHALRAFAAWCESWNFNPPQVHRAPRRSSGRVDAGIAYLAHTQRPDGSWLPLWFGNQHAPNEENPTYGTARVLAAYRDLGLMESEPARRGAEWLINAQNADGSWGGARGVPGSVEETSIALEVLLSATPPSGSLELGLDWLIAAIEADRLKSPEPIGFYFAKLWYYEKLYPMIFAVAALGRARRRFCEPPLNDTPT
jgi:squalene-hopene/tetraprenyl-beta-curcumene cyclase